MVLICCTCHFQSGSLCLFWLLLFASIFSVYFLPWHKGAKVVTYLGSLVQLCRWDGGILQTNIAGMCGECLLCMEHTGFAPAQGSMCFPGLSRSGSPIPCKCTDSVGHAFCALPRFEQLRRPGACPVHCPKRALRLYHLPGLGRLVSWVRHESIVWGVLCISSGELISGCDPPGRCQPPGSQEDVVSSWEPAHSLVEDAGLWGWDCSSPLPSGSGCRVPASLPPARGRGLYAAN